MAQTLMPKETMQSIASKDRKDSLPALVVAISSRVNTKIKISVKARLDCSIGFPIERSTEPDSKAKRSIRSAHSKTHRSG